MLDTTTKRRIDSARDILVGKIPDPKSQVEMITMAMIYKFMDDMDNEAVEYGGNRSFFTGDYEKFAWTKLFDLKLSGQDALNLYGDAIASFAFNPNLPQLFRDIFKNAYLPFRDPQTLKLFLKTINDFHYDHSEKLGDAFEYLLSVLGSQGDAGQFRTPRHIIDFMVEVLDPKKGETIADPACGTAGFLISSFKYIMAQNTKKTSGDLLTPDEKTKLMTQFTGFDISPDMVRLSLVNLYLHGFPKPHIEEYDTLTSEEKWDKYYDIILANPPFMTPKGGIRPHKRFTVQANKAEVLFTDYIAEHINPVSGKAAIVVPNGIVATTNKAYKDLRTLLVKESLLAVISLPAGVFQPYSGVKTSILILDRRLAKKSDNILFLKINNDGYDLGAQRRPIDKNDLPNALDIINKYREALANDKVFESDLENFTLVQKEDILANRDIILSAERYLVNKVLQTAFKLVKIGEVFKTSSGGTPLRNKLEYYTNGNIPWLKSGEVAQGYIYHAKELISDEGLKNSSAKLFPINSVLVAMYGATAGQVGILKFEATTNQAVCAIYPNEKAIPDYVYWILKQQTQAFVDLSGGGGQPNISQQIIKDFEIPLPPLNIQQEIVAEIEGYQKIIDGAKQVVKNYKSTFSINPDWEVVGLGEVCEDFKNGLNFGTDQVGRGTKFINIKDVFSDCYVNVTNLEKVDISEKEKTTKRVTDNDLLFVRSSVKYEGVGYPSLVKTNGENIVFCGFIIKCTPNKKIVIPEYLLYLLRTQKYRDATVSLSNRSSMTNISQDNLKILKVPIPSIEEQQTIVKSIEEEIHLVNANKRIIEIFEQKIKAKIDEVWGIKKDLIPVNF